MSRRAAALQREPAVLHGQVSLRAPVSLA